MICFFLWPHIMIHTDQYELCISDFLLWVPKYGYILPWKGVINYFHLLSICLYLDLSDSLSHFLLDHWLAVYFEIKLKTLHFSLLRYTVFYLLLSWFWRKVSFLWYYQPKKGLSNINSLIRNCSVMKKYPHILNSIDREFSRALEQFQNDPLFSSDQEVYTQDDKARMKSHWKLILKPFIRLKKIIRSTYWRSFFTWWSKNSFVIKYAAITTYYNMLTDVQRTFGRHEEFIRQYLDDEFSENYSTLARFMYHIRFYLVLSYPREFFLTLRDEVSPMLAPLFDRKEKYSTSMSLRLEHDGMNIWYYIRYRISLLLTWISKHGWRLMMHIKVKDRKHWLITEENIKKFETMLHPGDILLTRQNWTATNLNIPGFWKHMAMYVWTGVYIMEHYKDIYDKKSLHPETHYIIEAIGKWVQLIPICDLAWHNDYICAVRPRFSDNKVESAIKKTLPLIGTEYDYSFNYYSDVNYVCSTLVTKAYLPDSIESEWLHISLVRVATGITYPPNHLIKKMKHDLLSWKEELDFVAFLDSSEKVWTNFFADREAFYLSWDRPKLSFFLP